MSGSDIVRHFYADYFADKARTEREISRQWRANKLASSGLVFPEKHFHAALNELDEDDQEIIDMRHTQKLTNRQVAKKLGITEPMASMHYLRAMRRLRQIISKE